MPKLQDVKNDNDADWAKRKRSLIEFVLHADPDRLGERLRAALQNAYVNGRKHVGEEMQAFGKEITGA